MTLLGGVGSWEFLIVTSCYPRCYPYGYRLQSIVTHHPTPVTAPVTNSPSRPCFFGLLLSSFRTKFTRYSKSLCKKTHKKTSYNTRYPLGTKILQGEGDIYSIVSDLRISPELGDPVTRRILFQRLNILGRRSRRDRRRRPKDWRNELLRNLHQRVDDGRSRDR